MSYSWKSLEQYLDDSKLLVNGKYSKELSDPAFGTPIAHYFAFRVVLEEGACAYVYLSLQQAEYSELVETLLSSQQDPVIYQRLADAFNKLTASSTPPVLDRKQKMAFLKSLEEFMANVGGLLCVK